MIQPHLSFSSSTHIAFSFPSFFLRSPHSRRNLSSPSSSKPRKRVPHSIDSDHARPSSSSESRNPLTSIIDVPRRIWRQTLRPLSEFGFGRRSIWEGGVGLFLLSGTVLLALSLVWFKAFCLRSRFNNYSAVLEFSQACGLCSGTPVRIRGVPVGNVVRVIPSLRNIQAVVEIEDDKVIIPRNALVEVNQSGLLMETVIDITPKDPIPAPSVGPLHPDCVKEGLIVCDRQKIKGNQGVSLDELVGIFTRLGRDVERIGVSNTYSIAEQLASAVADVQPLLAKIQAIAEEVQPLLSEARNGHLLQQFEHLTTSLTQTCDDLRDIHSMIMSPENTEVVRNSARTLFFTLKNVERISLDVLEFTGDDATRRNLKTLIRSFSRLIL